MAHRLRNSASTYLRQHADNPVDWHEWGAEAFAEATGRNVPVLLSVGYASCHWCHVMAHESFENDRIASLINRDFVAIKVDREQRPDIDAIYMTATQALTGSGGWPMTVFLTPDGKPFYAGTYFPPEPRGGLPSFPQVLAAVAHAYRGTPDDVAAAADRVATAIAASSATGPGRMLTADDLAHACAELLSGLDTAHGGFGGAPKFPPTMALEFLLRHHERTGSTAVADAVTLTLDRMARGGIYDQLAGGFARYSVDATWHVPHFEKMLDDNAQLLRLYAHHARRTGSAFSQRIADETAAFLLREMRGPDGTFIAALDADAAGVEGLTYRWTAAQLRDVLGDDRAQSAAAAFRLAPGDDSTDDDSPNGEGADDAGPAGHVLRLAADLAETGIAEETRALLLAARAQRPQPGRDEITVLRGNGLAITALADAGAAAGRRDWIDAADRAADALIEALSDGSSGWHRSCFGGVPGPGRALLADEAALASGLLALYQATGDVHRLDAACAILNDWPARFADGDGSYFDAPDTPGDGPAISRPRDPTDGAAPSGTAAASEALLTAAAVTGSAAYREAAESLLASVGPLALRFPRSAGWHLSVYEALVAGPIQVAVAGRAGPQRASLAAAARRHAPGGSVIEVGAGDEPGRLLLADRRGIDPATPAAYVCRGFVCDLPVATVDELIDRLRHADAA